MKRVDSRLIVQIVSNQARLLRMHLLPPVEISDEKKLMMLQQLDQFRQWHSLDEKRYCLHCGALITGHEIQLVGGSRGTGPLRALCPTKHCSAIPMDWALPTDEVLARARALKGQIGPVHLN